MKKIIMYAISGLLVVLFVCPIMQAGAYWKQKEKPFMLALDSLESYEKKMAENPLGEKQQEKNILLKKQFEGMGLNLQESVFSTYSAKDNVLLVNYLFYLLAKSSHTEKQIIDQFLLKASSHGTNDISDLEFLKWKFFDLVDGACASDESIFLKDFIEDDLQNPSRQKNTRNCCKKFFPKLKEKFPQLILQSIEEMADKDVKKDKEDDNMGESDEHDKNNLIDSSSDLKKILITFLGLSGVAAACCVLYVLIKNKKVHGLRK
jgi:hypothetical protein